MEQIEDENHILKSALEFYANVCSKNDHPQLSRKCKEMAGKIDCDPKTKCTHNMIVQ